MRLAVSTAIVTIAAAAATSVPAQGTPDCQQAMKDSGKRNQSVSMLHDQTLRDTTRTLRDAARDLHQAGLDEACQDVVKAVDAIFAEAETRPEYKRQQVSGKDGQQMGASSRSGEQDGQQMAASDGTGQQQSADRSGQQMAASDGSGQQDGRQQASGQSGQQGNEQMGVSNRSGQQDGQQQQATGQYGQQQDGQRSARSGRQGAGMDMAGRSDARFGIDQSKVVPIAKADIEKESADLIGRNIYDMEYGLVAEIDGAMHDGDGNLTHIVASHGGFWNIGDAEVAIPVEYLGYSSEEKAIVTHIKDDQLDKAADWDFENGKWRTDSSASRNDTWFDNQDIEKIAGTSSQGGSKQGEKQESRG